MPERYFYIDATGSSYRLNLVSDKRSVLSNEGSGLPPIDYITDRGPFQHGETLRDYFLRPRVVQFALRQNFCSRQEMLDGRNTLLNAIRPNKTGGPTGTIRVIRPDGSRRDLVVAPLEGPRFEPDRLGSWDQWSIQEILRFIAYDPVYFDPTEHVETYGPCGPGASFPYTFPFAFAVPCEIQFPITFPITFEHFDFTDIINNAGTWQSFPEITISGPAAISITITNSTTGEVLQLLNFPKPDATDIVIDLTSSVKTITAGTTSLLPYLSEDSDLATFHLEPGDNTIRIQIGSYGAATYAQIRWFDRYVGI